MNPEDRLSSYDYQLPPELIAQTPAERRELARLLVVDRVSGAIEHRSMADFPAQLRPGDLLVLNNTQVVPARLLGARKSTGGKWEGLFLRVTPDGLWRIIGQTRGTLKPGEILTIAARDAVAPPLELRLVARHEGGEWSAECVEPGSPWDILDRYGHVPLPPYIERSSDLAEDVSRYQTVYASQPGAIAAPTAGLHFTPELLQSCQDRGATIAFVTLHVGLGTFRPVSTENLSEHVMHREWGTVPPETVAAVEAARTRGGRVIAVGTTSVRTLESASQSGTLQPWTGDTALFIRPPYLFRGVDALLTNFHLPKSTLLMLVSALAGTELIKQAYNEAIANRYRFFSYGDAMFIA
jgi:S-adenosylmethionine:tRNA ribosyltransferase-isomerase